MAFWQKLRIVFRYVELLQSKADPCLHFKWDDIMGLMMWLSWVDDLFGAGDERAVKTTKEGIKSQMECEETGELQEYIGCKLVRDVAGRTMKLTQPVLVQSLVDEFELPSREATVPATSGDVLADDEEDELLSPVEQTKYRSGVGKLLHLAKWSRVDILNRVRELSKYMTKPRESHFKAMLRVMKYVANTPERGLFLSPKRQWDGKDREFLFEVTGYADADYAADKETRRSVSGYCTLLEGALVMAKSKQQRCVTLSTTEAEMMSMTECSQDMLYTMRVLQSMGLKVRLPMDLFCDNKGAVDLANNWSTSGRSRHVATKVMFLRELKDEGVIKASWIPNGEMISDVFTKNLGDKDFKKCISAFVGEDQYG
jgi:hypothetical protein